MLKIETLTEAADRLSRYVEVDEASGCHNWTRATNEKGYGKAAARLRCDGGVRKTHRVHRIFYRARVGRIPAGKELDHLCRNRRCCNPGHLEAVTGAEHARRTRAVLGPRSEARARRAIELLAGGRTARSVAAAVGLSRGAVVSIARGATWPDLPRPWVSEGRPRIKPGRPGNEARARRIIALLGAGRRVREVARETGTGPKLVRQIRDGDKWAGLPRPWALPRAA